MSNHCLLEIHAGCISATSGPGTVSANNQTGNHNDKTGGKGDGEGESIAPGHVIYLAADPGARGSSQSTDKEKQPYQCRNGSRCRKIYTRTMGSKEFVRRRQSQTISEKYKTAGKRCRKATRQTHPTSLHRRQSRNCWRRFYPKHFRRAV